MVCLVGSGGLVVLGPYDPIDTGHAITLRSLILLFMIYDVLDSTRASCTSNGSLTPLQRNLFVRLLNSEFVEGISDASSLV